jgi:hypothetical protein
MHFVLHGLLLAAEFSAFILVVGIGFAVGLKKK